MEKLIYFRGSLIRSVNDERVGWVQHRNPPDKYSIKWNDGSEEEVDEKEIKPYHD